MRVSILGANGRSGVACLTACLAAGFSIKAGIHSTRPNIINENIEYIEFDGSDAASVDTLVAGSDVVISLIGHIKGSPSLIQTDTTKNVLAAMNHHDVPKLISLTGTGVRSSGDRPSTLDMLANSMIRLVDPERIKDGIKHAEIIRSSNIDWTIVRVLKLTNGKKQDYSLSRGGPAQIMTSRHTVAAAIVEILTNNSHAKSMPVISRAKAR